MKIRSIKEAKNLKGKRVLVRVDFNVPVKKGKVLDDTRIKSSLPTIEYLIKKGAVVILASHLGRPKGEVVKELSLVPVCKRLEQLLGRRVVWLSSRVKTHSYASLQRKIDEMPGGTVAMLENIRFSPDDEKDTGTLAKDLSKLADLFVLDGFAVAHRPAASVSGVAKFLPSYAGLLLAEEINGLTKVMLKPKRPLVVALGGAKAETKIPVIKNLMPKANYILVAGGIVNTYLWAKGYKVGASLIQKEFKKEVLKYCSNKKVILPVDFVVGFHDGSKAHVIPFDKKFKIQDSKMAIYDVGPRTVQLFSKYLKKAQTLIWNGAVGMFEVHPYQYGTYAMTHLFAARSKGKAFGVIGGGETVQVFEKLGLAKDVDLVSTGGGAMLEFLSGEKLPGVEAVRAK